MAFQKLPADPTDRLDFVLPEYQRISRAPDSESDSESDTGTLYKSCDKYGNIYLSHNPRSRKIKDNKNGTFTVIHIKPQFKMTRAQSLADANIETDVRTSQKRNEQIEF